jgi:hypothetical protein
MGREHTLFSRETGLIRREIKDHSRELRLFRDLSGDPGRRGGERKKAISRRDLGMSLQKQAAFHSEQRA